MDESDFDYENFEEISLMGDIIDKIEANDVWNETINEMIRRGDAVRRPDGKVIFSDQVPDFDIVEDIASYTRSDIKSAEWQYPNTTMHYGDYDSDAQEKYQEFLDDWNQGLYGDPLLDEPPSIEEWIKELDEQDRRLQEYEGTEEYERAMREMWDAEKKNCGCGQDPCITYGAETFEAPLVGAGATMDITKDSSLSSFTPEELTGSSAIHGDFDHASLNYSGHQNIEARAEWDYAHDSGATVPKYYQDDEELPIYKYFMDSATAPYHIHGLDTFYMPEGKDYYWNKIKEKFMPADYRPDESEEWRDIHWQEEADWDAILNTEFVDELYEKWLANHEYNAIAKIAENDPDWAIQNEARLEAVGYFAESSIQKAEETFGLVQPNFWMNYPITGMLAMVGLFAIGKTLLNSRKEEM